MSSEKFVEMLYSGARTMLRILLRWESYGRRFFQKRGQCSAQYIDENIYWYLFSRTITFKLDLEHL